MAVWVMLALSLLTAGTAWADQPVLRALSAGGTETARNGDFRQGEAGRAADWNPYQDGYRWASGIGRDGSAAIECANADEKARAGAMQTIALRQERPAPLIVSGWSKAEAVSGSPDNDYSLYVDLLYTDGTPLWGQAAPFSTGTHDWEKQEVLIVPEKPIASLTLYGLFRGRQGRVWFDDLSVRAFNAGKAGTVFDGRPVQLPGKQPAGSGALLATRDGLALRYDPAAARVTGVRLNGKALRASGAPGGFLVRDNAAGPAVYGFRNGRCAALGLTLTTQLTAAADHLSVAGQIRDETGRDRALTLFFTIPFPRGGGQWHTDARRTRPLVAGDYLNAAPVGGGATGTMSRYPWACVTGPAGGLALGLDMDRPAQFRLFYNADLQALAIAYDLGLAPETKHFPSAAPFRFVIYSTDASWGFRSAAARYQRIFPQFYTVRSKQQGIWMPFTDVSTVQGWQDFGFRYHEGDNNVPFDDRSGILSFRYTEPSTYWMAMPKGMPRTTAAALAERQRLQAQGNAEQQRWAATTANAAIYDAAGEPQLRLLDTPWCDGAVWSLCPLPEITGEVNAATLHWNPAAREARYGAGAKGFLDGEYLDSLEGYVTADLNFRRDHFAAVNAPLTFDTRTRRPAIHKGLAIWEFTRWMAADVHRMDKLMFANSVPYRFPFLTGYLDVMGTETNWLSGSEYRPAEDATLLQFRTLSGAKPYLLLMNTDFDRFTSPLVERYFQRSLFYGIYPSMFSFNAAEKPYWGNPAWYNRDRALFQRYQPVIRQVAEAGWQPVTLARCTGADVERFGGEKGSACYFTLHNPGEKPVEASLALTRGAPRGNRLVDLLSGEVFTLRGGKARLPLPADGVRALRLE